MKMTETSGGQGKQLGPDVQTIPGKGRTLSWSVRTKEVSRQKPTPTGFAGK
jgi:hypothetical protein